MTDAFNSVQPAASSHRNGDKPLAGVRVIEVEALGPVPWACMLLADLGADVVRIERPGADSAPDTYGSVIRGRRRVMLDLKSKSGREAFLVLAERADVLVEGMRPGVMERLQLGPADVFARNAHIVYGRMTGWGQHGPLAQRAGHDINYIALTGVLDAIGTSSKPALPLNLIGDFGGGGCFLLIGVLAALAKPKADRRDVVIDCAMVDGASNLMALIYSRMNMGQWVPERESNPLDGGVPWYDTYLTADGKRIAVGALEPKFYHNLISKLGLTDTIPDRADRRNWTEIRRRLEECFLSRTRDEWEVFFDGIDACVTPVLNLSEAFRHEHLSSRGSVLQTESGGLMPAPAPIFGGERLSVAGDAKYVAYRDIEAGWL